MKTDLLVLSDEDLLELYKIISNYIKELEKMKEENDRGNQE